MAELKAFCALRFAPKAGELAELVCPPYDIVGEEERQALLARNKHNLIRLELPREGEDPYREAGGILKQWLEEDILVADGEPGLYIYEEQFTVRGERLAVKGLVGLVRQEPWEKGVILPHEETLSKAKTDRLNLMKATGCNLSSVYSLYFDQEKRIFPALERLSAGEPLLRFETGDGILHSVWKVSDRDEIAMLEGAFADKKLYIADGHHRYETGLNYRRYLEEQTGGIDHGHPANYIMMTLVNMESNGLVVFPTHRIVRDIPGFDTEKLLESCKDYFKIEDAGNSGAIGALEALAAEGKKAFGFYCGGKTRILTLTDDGIMAELLPDRSRASRSLDVSILHTLVLERLLGIDRENMRNQKNLIYTRDPEEAVAAVDNGEADCAFLINATRVEEIAAVASAGEKMPQKSTYFYPKLITGHLMNQIV